MATCGRPTRQIEQEAQANSRAGKKHTRGKKIGSLICWPNRSRQWEGGFIGPTGIGSLIVSLLEGVFLPPLSKMAIGGGFR